MLPFGVCQTTSGCARKKSRLNIKITGEFCIIFFAGRPEKMKKMQNLQIGGGYWSKFVPFLTNIRTGSNREFPIRGAVAGVATTRPRTAPRRTLAGSQGGGTNAPCTCSQGVLHLTATSSARPAGPQRGLGPAAPGRCGGRTAQKLFPARIILRCLNCSLSAFSSLPHDKIIYSY